MKRTLVVVATLAALSAIFSAPTFALKYAEPEHNLKIDPSLPSWQPGEVKSEPEEELAIVGADIMDEVVLGWTKTQAVPAPFADPRPARLRRRRPGPRLRQGPPRARRPRDVPGRG